MSSGQMRDAIADFLEGGGWGSRLLQQAAARRAGLFHAIDFGVVAGGTTDCTSAIQAALDATAAAGGGVVLLPPGTLKTTAPLIVPTLVQLAGAGTKATKIAFAPASALFAVQLGVAAGDDRWQGFRDCWLTCASPAAGAFDIRDTARFGVFERLLIEGFSAASGIGVKLSGQSSCNCFHRFVQCQIKTFLAGAVLSGNANANTLQDCHFSVCGTGLDFTATGTDTHGGADNFVQRCEIDGSTALALALGSGANRNIFSQLQCDGATASVTHHASAQDNAFLHCHLSPAPDANTLALGTFLQTSFGESDETNKTRLRELSLTEVASTPPDPSASDVARLYVKGNTLIIQFNDAGTVRYKSLDLTGTGVTWVHATSAP